MHSQLQRRFAQFGQKELAGKRTKKKEERNAKAHVFSKGRHGSLAGNGGSRARRDRIGRAASRRRVLVQGESC